MTTPSNFSETGIAIYATEPLVSASSMKYQWSLSQMVSGYSHIIAANGGYKSASISMNMRQDEIEDWLEYGLGRNITVYNEGGVPVWGGFVNDIVANVGGLNVMRGPLMGIANAVNVIYSTVDINTDPPTMGVRAKTGYAYDLVSQDKYGIIIKVLSSGGSTPANALNIRNTYLAEMAQPETSQTISIGESGNLDITINCLGYEEWLRAYIYNTTGTGGTTVSAKIQLVLAADPNNIISSDYSKITANTLAIPVYANDDDLALDYINSLVTLGDAAYNRYTFGIYANQRAEYTVMPRRETYIWHLADGGMLTNPYGGIIEPWNVLPARWVLIPDFMIGRVSPTAALRDDPRYMFIESLTFTAPYGLTLTGSKISKMPQIFSQMGLGGIGA